MNATIKTTAVALVLCAALSTQTYATIASLCNDEGDTCIVKKIPNGPALGTFQNPKVDNYPTTYHGHVHSGLYCAAGEWHHGWLKAWETSPVIKPSCGNAASQILEQ